MKSLALGLTVAMLHTLVVVLIFVLFGILVLVVTTVALTNDNS